MDVESNAKQNRDNFRNYYNRYKDTMSEAKKGVFDDVCAELEAELSITDFAHVDEVAQKYKDWLIKFNSYRSPEKLKRFKAIVERERAKLADKEANKFLPKIVEALKNSANIYLFFEENNISITVFEIILKNENSQYANMKKDIEKIINRYNKDLEKVKLEQEHVKSMKVKQDKYASSIQVIKKFITGQTASIKEFLE